MDVRNIWQITQLWKSSFLGGIITHMLRVLHGHTDRTLPLWAATGLFVHWICGCGERGSNWM